MLTEISRRTPCVAGIAAGLLLAVVAPTAGAARFSRIQGFNEPGTPSQYDKVGVLKVGPKSAKNVLILIPGTSASAAYFKPMAKDIVAGARHSRGAGSWQVWSIERRENLLEDQSYVDKYKRGEITTQQLFDYYLGWLTNGQPPPHFAPVADASVPFARDWGMRVAVEDIHNVVKLARKGGHRVVLGGHSLGGAITTAYATWDFNGRPGVKELAGLVYIDGGSSFGDPPTTQEAQDSLDQLEGSSPFLDLLGLGLPWAAGAFNVVGSNAAHRDPDTLSAFTDWPPAAALAPPVDATNEASYGYALDTETALPSLALVQVHTGKLAASGDPRPWDDAGELTPVQRVARMFAGSGLEGLDGTAWYHPRRLSIDSGAVNSGVDNPAQNPLSLDAIHGDDVHVPIYAFATSLGDGRVLDAARVLAKHSGIPKRRLTLVDRSAGYAHVDPMGAAPKNAFVRALIPFLAETHAKHKN